MFNVFKITNTGRKNNSGQDLLGLLIVQTDEGYFLVDPEYMLKVPRILSNALTEKNPQGSFKKFHFKELHWTITIDKMPLAKTNLFSPPEMSGTWFNGDDIGAEDNWVATGTGTGIGDPDDNEARAASAK